MRQKKSAANRRRQCMELLKIGTAKIRAGKYSYYEDKNEYAKQS
ncbi:MAG: hypothetical protein SVR04_02245 [Spirochaetota bacterium]|nr:hypothetical protein [Spirochaetota bacterium]